MELEEFFERELWLARQSNLHSSTRGDSFWNSLKQNLIKGILNNRDLTTVTLRMITRDSLIKLKTTDIDLDQHKTVIVILVALEARAVWDTLEKNTKANTPLKQNASFQNQSATLDVAQRALAILEQQAAGYTSLTIPVHLQIQLEDKRKEVAALENQVIQSAKSR